MAAVECVARREILVARRRGQSDAEADFVTKCLFGRNQSLARVINQHQETPWHAYRAMLLLRIATWTIAAAKKACDLRNFGGRRMTRQ